MEVVYVRGGDKTAPEVARLSGMAYGTRHDYKPYAPVYMLDVDFHAYEQLTSEADKEAFWQVYLAKVREHRPHMALVPDYMRPTQRAELYRQIRDMKPLVSRILVCPKFPGAVAHIPSWCIVAVSVPTRYAGFLPENSELRDRQIHLLGGSVRKQADLIRKLTGAGAVVVSVDGSHHALKAGHGQWFDGGRWVQLRRHVVSDTDLTIASARNIIRYLRAASGERQEALF
jgi:hypothetical protein